MLRRQFRKARRANSVRAHGNILNLTYEYVYRAYEFKWRRRLWRVFETVWSEQLLCSLESFVPYEFTVLRLVFTSDGVGVGVVVGVVRELMT